VRRFGFGWVDKLLIVASLVAPPGGKGNLVRTSTGGPRMTG